LNGGDDDLPIAIHDLHDMMRGADALDVTAEDFAAFDDSEFDTTGIDIPTELSDPRAVFVRLCGEPDMAPSRDNAKVVHCGTPSSSVQAEVRPATGRTFLADDVRKPLKILVPLVVRAYADVRSGASTDYVVLEPELNLLFLHRCWELGAAASPEELNWILMNARKDGKISELPKAQKFSIPKRDLDTYSFGTEVALRYVQDRVLRDEHRELSLDKLLCSPKLAAEFDGLAGRIVPGHTSIQYRWAAMALRKARRLPKQVVDVSIFQEVGLLEDIRPSTVASSRGLYWVEIGDCSTFVGIAENLRTQIDAFVDRLGNQVIPEWYGGRPIGKARMSLMEAADASVDEVAQFQSGVIRLRGSRLNFRDESLFGNGKPSRKVG
jgi:site-specific DNA-methyltransferase (adenine-specific)